MYSLGVYALILGSALTALAALAHLACIAIGASAYKLQPTVITVAIALLLFIWSAYALSGAGVISRLPFTKFALLAISAVFLMRALAFPLLKSTFPENSDRFWWVSSAICFLIGLLYAFGLFSIWKTR
jgi:hypothetical protein